MKWNRRGGVGIEVEDRDNSGKCRPFTSNSTKYSHLFQTPIPRDINPLKKTV
jgi:hypothetical protein